MLRCRARVGRSNREPAEPEAALPEPTPVAALPEAPVAPAEPEPVPEPDPFYYEMGDSGGYYAQSIESVFITDRIENVLRHVNATTGEELANYQLTAKANEVVYLEETNTLYVSLQTANQLVKISLTDGAVKNISIAGPALSILTHNARVFFTTATPDEEKFSISSVGADDIVFSHGEIDGDLIVVDPVANKLISIARNIKETKIARYAEDVSGNLVREEGIITKGANATNAAISIEGRLAITMESSGQSLIGVKDYNPASLLAPYGAWHTSLGLTSVGFSPDGKLFGATSSSSLAVFDSTRHLPMEYHDIDRGLCGSSAHEFSDVSFTADGSHIMGKLSCIGDEGRNSVLFYYPIPNADTPSLVPEVEQDEIADGEVRDYYRFNEIGDYYVQSANKVFVADKTENKLLVIDITSGTETASYELDARPMHLEYFENTDTLYIGFDVAAKIVKIEFATNAVTEIMIDGAVESMSGYSTELFFTTERYGPVYYLRSLDSNNTTTDHGIVEGNLVAVNPQTGEIIIAERGQTPDTSIHRYEIDTATPGSPAMIKETVEHFGANVSEISFSADGFQMAVVSDTGNGVEPANSIFDTNAYNLSTASGEWDIGASPVSSVFSPLGDTFMATDGSNVLSFDPVTHVLRTSAAVGESSCNSGSPVLSNLQYDALGGSAFINVTCGYGSTNVILTVPQ